MAAATSTGSTSSPGREISSSAAPRISCERITPELPRAPSSAARATESTIWSRPISSISPCVERLSSSLQDGAQRQRHVVARVAVGDREDVEVVDLLAPRFKLRESRLDDEAETEEARVGQRCPAAARYALVTLPALRQRVQT